MTSQLAAVCRKRVERSTLDSQVSEKSPSAVRKVFRVDAGKHLVAGVVLWQARKNLHREIVQNDDAERTVFRLAKVRPPVGGESGGT